MANAGYAKVRIHCEYPHKIWLQVLAIVPFERRIKSENYFSNRHKDKLQINEHTIPPDALFRLVFPFEVFTFQETAERDYLSNEVRYVKTDKNPIL